MARVRFLSTPFSLPFERETASNRVRLEREILRFMARSKTSTDEHHRRTRARSRRIDATMEVAGASATGLIALLDEPSAELQAVALQRIAPVVDQLWYQVAGAVSSLEALHENETFAERELAALVASKVRKMERKRRKDAKIGRKCERSKAVETHVRDANQRHHRSVRRERRSNATRRPNERR